MFRRALVLSALLCLPASGALAAPFTNGSFESGSVNPGSSFLTLGAGSTAITGWEVFGATIDYIGTFWQAADGSRSVDLNGNAGPAGIRQTFDTEAGALYEVTFALAGNPDGAPATKTVQVTSGAFTQLYTFTLPGGTTHSNMNWEYHSLLFTASSGLSTVSFLSQTSGAYFGPALDNVSVSTVPEPATLSLLALGLAGTIVRRRGRR